MENLYLIRHKRFELYGPFSKKELKSYLKERDIEGWEVCGSLGTWVPLEKEDGVKSHYSELWKELTDTPFSIKKFFQKKD